MQDSRESQTEVWVVRRIWQIPVLPGTAEHLVSKWSPVRLRQAKREGVEHYSSQGARLSILQVLFLAQAHMAAQGQPISAHERVCPGTHLQDTLC